MRHRGHYQKTQELRKKRKNYIFLLLIKKAINLKISISLLISMREETRNKKNRIGYRNEEQELTKNEKKCMHFDIILFNCLFNINIVPMPERNVTKER